MSAGKVIAERSWKVGGRTCTLTVRARQPGAALQASAEWTPDVPSDLTPAEWAEYLTGRHRALGEIAAALGVTVAVMEI